MYFFFFKIYILWIKALLFGALNFKRMIYKKLPNPLLVTHGGRIKMDSILQLCLRHKVESVRSGQALAWRNITDQLCRILFIKSLWFWFPHCFLTNEVSCWADGWWGWWPHELVSPLACLWSYVHVPALPEPVFPHWEEPGCDVNGSSECRVFFTRWCLSIQHTACGSIGKRGHLTLTPMELWCILAPSWWAAQRACIFVVSGFEEINIISHGY